MKVALIGAVALASASFAAVAQVPPPAPAATVPPPAAPSAPAAGDVLDGDTPIETIVALPAARAALEKQFPDMLAHPAYEQFKSLSLRQLAPLAGGLITDEEIAAFEADVKAAASRKQ